jgi:conjugative relaxase-like TrwC/TraI family protein
VRIRVLTITKLGGAEYLIASVAEGLEDYYMGAGEAPGVWSGGWAAELGLEGVVTTDALRALVNGHHPVTGEDLLAGHRARTVRAVDVTLSVPKSVSLLWAFGTPETSTAVSLAVVEATETALAFLEERAAVTRVQAGGVRRQVPTAGFTIGTFAHRTSRAGDPQLHVHCLIPNVVRRADGAFVAIDAHPLHVWAKATGTVFLNEVERLLIERLGVAWGPERNGSRELLGFGREQLREFSKRSVDIEEYLEQAGETVFESARARMRADDRASVVTRPDKDRTLTPERLRDRWAGEALTVGLEPGHAVDDLVCDRAARHRDLTTDEVFTALVDPATGLCALRSRFTEAHVVERIAALSGGRHTLTEILTLTDHVLASDHVVRLVPDASGRRPAEWSTVELRAVEDQLLADVETLTRRAGAPIPRATIGDAVAAEARPLGADQIAAVRMLCGAGAAVRLLAAPAGHGKTTALHAAVTAAHHAGREVVVAAPTHQAVAELHGAGLEAETVAHLRHRLTNGGELADGTVLVVDEISQLATRDAAVLLHALADTPDGELWCVGDVQQIQPVAAGGLAHELQRLAEDDGIPSASLAVNRRQRDPAEREALREFRIGELETSQTIRTEHGWEHEHATPAATRDALAAAAVVDADRHGAEQVAVLAVAHTDCEDLADRIRTLRTARGELRGPTRTGPGWGPDPRVYAAGDRILVHTNQLPDRRVRNGATGIITHVTGDGLAVVLDTGAHALLPAELVAGRRPDGTPNISHAWARTIAGAQGGTWAQVHLLATPTLDRETTYVGQSRGRLPTQTWNTRPDPDAPAPLLADQRTPSEAVLAAAHRSEPKTLAAADDPWALDRRLRAERDEHTAIIKTRPADRTRDLDDARRALRHATSEHDGAVGGLAYRQTERARLGPLTRLRRHGRDAIDRADDAVDAAHTRLHSAQHALDTARTAAAGLEAAVDARAAWDRQHLWRINRVAAIDHTLDHHWADVTVRAARAGDPFAYGIDRVHQARRTLTRDLNQILNALPSDRTAALGHLEAQLRDSRRRLRDADRSYAQAQVDLEAARQRRWGRRDHAAIQRAERTLSIAEGAHEHITKTTEMLACNVENERDAQHAHDRALRDTAGRRSDLTAAVQDLEAVISRLDPGPDLTTLLLEHARAQFRPARELDHGRSPDHGLDLGL